jgi:hypothetical protein
VAAGMPLSISFPLPFRDRRPELRTELHRRWQVTVEADLLRPQQGRILDYSPSGMKLLVDGSFAVQVGDVLKVSYPGADVNYEATVVWLRHHDHDTLMGVCITQPA